MICIFCEEENDSKSIEHIVPESFGNRHYVLPLGAVCDNCNNSFSQFEGKALTNSVYVMERSRLGIPTKKGKAVKGKVNELVVEADKNFRKQVVTMYGLNEKNVHNYDKNEGTFQVTVSAFDKSESAASKLFLTMGLESLFKSRKEIYNKYDFENLRNYINKKENKDWPFIASSLEPMKFISIPSFNDKHLLNRIHCKLRICEIDDNTLLFRFEYGGISMIINMLNRNLAWIKEYFFLDKEAAIHPKHFRTKLKSL